MADIIREETSDILTRMEKNRWPMIAGVASSLSLIVSIIALCISLGK